MAKNDNLKDFITDIADAIRAKKGSNALINPQNFSSEIASIETGGGMDWLNDVTQKDVNFYDYDGRRLYSYSWEEAVALTELPALPTRKGLVCQEWNYTLDDIKAQSHHKADIGATYITDDGKTRIYHETTTDNASVTIGYTDNVTENNKAEVIVDWGDGTTSIHGGSGNAQESHTYAKAGVYMITLEVPEEHGNTYFEFFSGSRLIKVETGERMTFVENSATNKEKYLRTISLSRSIRGFSDTNTGVFQDTKRLEALIFPRGCSVNYTLLAKGSGVKVVSLPPAGTFNEKSAMFNECNDLYSIVIPQGTTTIGSRCFSDCENLSNVALPNSITSINDAAFSGCSSLTQLIFSHFNAIPSIYNTSHYAIPNNCTSIYVPSALYDDWKTRWGTTYASRIIRDFTPTDCIELSITADDVGGRAKSTTVHYVATCNGTRISSGEAVVDVIKGTSASSEFPQNTSYTDTVTREISFTYLGVTAVTTITQGVWVDAGYTVDLNGGQWELSDTPTNPDATIYDGVYRSVLSKGVNNGADTMYIDIVGYSTFKLYVRSYAESGYDYVMVSQLDKEITGSSTSTSSTVKASTKDKSNSGTGISAYTLVEFTGIDGGSHRITVVYRKDGSGNNNDDRGYVLIPKEQ